MIKQFKLSILRSVSVGSGKANVTIEMNGVHDSDDDDDSSQGTDSGIFHFIFFKICREEGDIGLLITLVPKVLQYLMFIICLVNNFRDTY